MIELIELLTTLGNNTLEQVWFPLLVWTAFAVPVTYLLHRSDSIPPIYQYHGRVALLLVLPLGIAGSYFVDLMSSSSQSVAAATKFIVIQNPITVSASTDQLSMLSALSDPTVWIGFLSFLLVTGAACYLLKMAFSFFQLKKIELDLTFQPICQNSQLVSQLPNLGNEDWNNPLIAFSEEATIPFTFGCRKTKIVIPKNLQEDPETLAMAVQHELMHIKRRDFLLNSILLTIRSLFWIHPLIHYLYNSSREYREITCDSELLAGNNFSKKRYATLLFELAQREHQTNLAMSMAVNPSTLKKRIQIMSQQTFSSNKLRSSFLLTIASACILVLAMACSDISSDGITKKEVKQTQSQMAQNESADHQQLFVLNGERLTSEERIQKLSRIKPKYIKSINALKGEKAIEKYGKAGENGVIEIFMWNETIEKAFTDLQEKGSSIKQKDHEDYFVAVEDMPELKGDLVSLQKKINYPETARKAGIEGKVIVQFIVNEQGEVEKPQVIRGIGGGCDKEALRVVKEAEFIPGKQRGKPVRVQFSLPITYRLPDNPENSQS